MRICIVIALVLAFLVLACPSVALAAPETDANKKVVGVKSGLFKGAIELSLWTILVFLILVTLLRKYAWGPIREGLDKREQSIAHDKNEAIKAKQEADAMRAKLEAEEAKANDKIRQMMDKARQDGEALAAEKLTEGEAKLAAERERQKRELQIEKDDALHKMWDHSARLATLISSKVIHKQLHYDDHRALIGEALAEFRQSLEGRKQDMESARA
jgi:F-type H+-transporting ATPase subunit b